MPFILIMLLSLCTGYAQAEDRYRKAQITEPYIELHTGPGRGYPVFHVIDRGEWIESSNAEPTGSRSLPATASQAGPIKINYYRH